MAAPVLVGVDGSPDAADALRWAADFARRTERELQVAHAWQHGGRLQGLPPITTSSRRASRISETEQAVEARLRTLTVDVLGDDSVVSAWTPLRGVVGEALAKEATRVTAELLVVGARGVGGVRGLLLGSVSRAVAEHPPCPVAVVRRYVAIEPPEGQERWTIAVGVDGSDNAARALRWACDTALRSGAGIVAVHAFECPVVDADAAVEARLFDETHHRLEDEWCAPLVHAGVEHHFVIEKGDPREVIGAAAEVVRPACVVVGTRGLGGLPARVLGGVTDHLIRRLQWPVVVVPPPE
jgi:nucleotide-binding universal stress UspA family protein